MGCNQFAMDIAVDRLDGEVDHASERISALEGKVTDLEAGCTELLALGQEQVETSMRSCQGHSTLTLPVHYSAPSQGQLVQLVVLTW